MTGVVRLIGGGPVTIGVGCTIGVGETIGVDRGICVARTIGLTSRARGLTTFFAATLARGGAVGDGAGALNSTSMGGFSRVIGSAGKREIIQKTKPCSASDNAASVQYGAALGQRKVEKERMEKRRFSDRRARACPMPRF